MIDAHADRIRPHTNPGALYCRLASSSGVLIDARPVGLSSLALVDLEADQDARAAARWMADHPTDTVTAYLYDGDSGEQVAAVIIGFKGAS